MSAPLLVFGRTGQVGSYLAAMPGVVALVHVSTDYVFDGSGERPWRPEDTPAPLNAYGRSTLAGERAVAGAGGVHAILRTSWVVSARGRNFLTTMLRLGAGRDRLTVVADQIGGPTPAADLAAACHAVALRLIEAPDLSGLYHYAGHPDTSWAGFARAIMEEAGLACEIIDIATADWPTPAARPLNSRLDCGGLAALGLARPDWRGGLRAALIKLNGETP